MAYKFEMGKDYGMKTDKTIGLITMIGRTNKMVKMNRSSDYGYGGDNYTADKSGEHRYKIQIDEDGDEYTIIDRFVNMRGFVWGTKISSNPNKSDMMVQLSFVPRAYEGPAPIWQEHA